jgi:hypothetical protein
LAVSKKKPKEFGSGQPPAIQVRGSAEWKQWVEELAKFLRQPVSGLVDTSLARTARESGFREPPKR